MVATIVYSPSCFPSSPVFSLFMQPFQYRFHFLRYRQAKICYILQKAHTLIGNIEKDNSCSKRISSPNHIHIQDVCEPHKQKDQHFLADALKSHFTGKLPVSNRTHQIRDVSNHYKSQQCAYWNWQQVILLILSYKVKQLFLLWSFLRICLSFLVLFFTKH